MAIRIVYTCDRCAKEWIASHGYDHEIYSVKLTTNGFETCRACAEEFPLFQRLIDLLREIAKEEA